MKSQKLCVITFVFIISLIPCTALADSVTLKNGRVIEGDVIYNDDKEVRIVIEQYGVKSTLILNMNDVSSIQKEQKDTEKKEPDGTEKEFENVTEECKSKMEWACCAPTNKEKAQRILEVSRWAVSKGMIKEALKIYQESVDLDPAIADIVEIEAARLAMQYQFTDKAKAILKKTLERNPNHEEAKQILSQIKDKIQEQLQKEADRALKCYNQRAHEEALILFIKMVDSWGPEEINEISNICKNSTGQGLAALMADCRINRKCESPLCDKGLVPCPNPNCKQGKVRFVGREVENPYGQIVNSGVVWKFCDTCKGARYLTCQKCKGSGIDIGRPTDYEKEELAKTMVSLAQNISNKINSYNIENMVNNRYSFEQRISNAYNVLSDTQLAQFFINEALKLNPLLGSRGGQNLSEKFKDISNVRSNTLYLLSKGFFGTSDSLYQEAVNQKGSQGTKSLAGRALKAHEAIEFAEEARVFALQALQEDSVTASPLKGDMQHFLSFLKDYLERCKRALITLRNLEKQSTNEKVCSKAYEQLNKERTEILKRLDSIKK